jgi:hypothetical protein
VIPDFVPYEKKPIRNFLIPWILVLALIWFAGCTGVSGPFPAPSETTLVPAESPASPDNQQQSPAHDNSTVTVERTGSPEGGTVAYRANITDMNKNPLTRDQFLATNREYIAFLGKELRQEKAEQIVNAEYFRLIGPSLLDPLSGNDTLISISIDPVGDHVAGETFTISGSTNLPPGRELTLAVFRGNYDRPIPPGEDAWRDPIMRTAVVQANMSSENIWSYRMDTTGMAGDDYLVYVRESQKDEFYTNTLFHLFSPDRR